MNMRMDAHKSEMNANEYETNSQSMQIQNSDNELQSIIN